MFENKEIAALSALALAVSPELYIWARTQADIDLPFMMLSAFAFFFSVVFAKNKNRRTLSMFAFAAILAVYMRIEGVLLVPLFIFLFFVYSSKGVKETFKESIKEAVKVVKEDSRTLLLLLLFIILLFPEVHYVALESENPNYGQNTDESVISLSNFKQNIRINLYYVFGLINGENMYPTEFLNTATPLALLGILLLFLNYDRANKAGIAALLGLWPLLYFLF